MTSRRYLTLYIEARCLKYLDGILDKLVYAINVSYANTRAKLYSPDDVSEEFDIVAGVLQVDTLSPYLFIIVLDYALRKAINGHEEELGFTIVARRSRRLHPTVLTDLDFSDDIFLLSIKNTSNTLVLYQFIRKGHYSKKGSNMERIRHNTNT